MIGECWAGTARWFIQTKGEEFGVLSAQRAGALACGCGEAPVYILAKG